MVIAGFQPSIIMRPRNPSMTTFFSLRPQDIEVPFAGQMVESDSRKIALVQVDFLGVGTEFEGFFSVTPP